MIKFFVDRPLFTISVFIIMLVIGVFSMTNIPIDLLPDISFPSISVVTVYPGASAEDIESTVTKYIEDAVATVPNFEKVQSNSAENISTVTVSFKWGTNLDTATSDLRDKIDLVKSKLPDDSQSPIIFKFDLSMIPVLMVGVTADESYDDLYRIADKQIAQELKKIPGVGAVSILGGKKRQINVDIDRTRLDAYKIPFLQAVGAIQAGNLTIPAGSIKVGKLEYSIRIPGEYTSVDQMSETIIGNVQGRNIYLKDVANVSDSYKEQTGAVRVGGEKAVLLMIQKQSGANSVQVSNAAQKGLKRIEGNLPKDLNIKIISDSAESISNSIANLSSTLMWSLLFVALTVLFFLRNFRGSLIVSLVIPFSLISAFIYLYLSKSSINIISLASIVIAIGMVVDNAIVVLENIYSHRDKKNEPLREASIFGASEVAGAVLASTITNLVVFVPVIMVEGFAAIFFRQLAFTITVVLTMSLFASLTLTPMLASKLLDVKKSKNLKNDIFSRFYRKSEEWFDLLDEKYKDGLAWALSHRKRLIIVCALIFFFSMPLFTFVGTEFFPDQDTGHIQATIQMPVGTRWEETSRIMEKVEAIIKEEVPETRFYLVRAGVGDSSSGMIAMRVVPKDKRTRSSEYIQRIIAEKIRRIPGIKSIDFASTSGANQMTGGGKPISIEIYGYDIEKTNALAENIKSKLEKVPGAVDPIVSREKVNPELWVNVDRSKVAAMGLTMSDVALALRNSVYGNESSKYRESGEEYDIFLRLDENNRKTLEDLGSIFVTSKTGKNIPLSNIARFEKRSGPLSIQRKNQERILFVEAGVFGRTVGDINSDIRKIISRMQIPSGITIKYGGSAEQMKDSFSQLGIALLIGIILIYLVMVAQFESLMNPFIIMFSVPFALVGVVWSLIISGLPFGIMPFIGTIMVVGIVVNNAIVLIDYTGILRARGLSLQEAILQGGRSRLRPILMTTGTTILGLAPMVFGRGEGAEFWTPLGVSVIGGLLFSTLITLFFVPVMYTIIEEKMKRREFCGEEIK